MARESCNLDKDEAEILTPSSSSSSNPSPTPAAPPPAPSPPSLFLKPAQDFPPQRPGRPLASPAPAAARKDDEPETAVRFGNRCSTCRKRVGLTGFRCRCGDLFCGQHRYSDTHDCSFDYKAAGREEISKNNPVVRAAKIIKI